MPREQVLIGFGAARFRSTSTGYEAGPVKEFRRLMGLYGQLIETPEYRTSITCSECLAVTADAILPVRKRHGPPTLREWRRFGEVCWQKRMPVKEVQVSTLAPCSRDAC